MGMPEIPPAPAPEARAAPGTGSPILKRLLALHARHAADRGGRLAAYIPELAKADPDAFGIAVATVDGEVYEVGDSRRGFTIQSISKPFVYGMALADHGEDEALRRIGVEPSGETFNSVVFDERANRPFNPMVNAGAIAATAMVGGASPAEREGRVLATLGRFAGRPLGVDEAVYLSERATGHRNRAIAHLELGAGMIAGPVEEHLDLYFRQCAVLADARDLAVMAATLANGGSNPLTGGRALAPGHVRGVLSVMASCGMYDFSGEWGFRVGLPAKSGVAGGIIAVLPGQLGIGVFSPPLDGRGNSVRGTRVCEDLSRRFGLHLFDAHAAAGVAVRRSYDGGSVRSKRMRRPRHQAVLDRSGAAVRVHELQGDLFFASAERVARRAASDAGGAEFLILDGRRVGRVDPGAWSLLADVRDALAARGVRLLLAGFPPARPDAPDDAPDAPGAAGGAPRRAGDSFASADEALEWCEDRLVARAAGAAGAAADDPRGVVPLGGMDVAAGLGAAELAVLDGLASRRTYAPGEPIVREGDEAGDLLMLAAGSATVSVGLGAGGRRKRLGSIDAGVTFGELALFEGGPRTADVTADTAAVCYVLSAAGLRELSAAHPALEARLLRNVGRVLARRLRQANEEIRALEA